MDTLKERAEYCSRIICSTFQDQSKITDLILLELKGEGECISTLIKGLNDIKKKNNKISKIVKKTNKKIRDLEEEAKNEIAEIIEPKKRRNND